MGLDFCWMDPMATKHNIIQAKINSPYYEWIEHHRKTIEIRRNRDKWKTQALPGTLLRVTNPETLEQLTLQITERTEYGNFEECLRVHLDEAMPGLEMKAALQVYREIYGASEESASIDAVVALRIEIVS
jgi:ASC-1-like (ASCH) protein